MIADSNTILSHMAVPGLDGVYTIGQFEQRITLYSQQVRALNLIYSLHEQSILHDGCSVVIVGAGPAGMTAAAAASKAGCKVKLLDRLVEPMTRIANPKRWLHPRIYDWPVGDTDGVDCRDGNARLPIMNWRADRADRVSESLWQQFQRTAQKDRIVFIPRCSPIQLDYVRRTVSTRPGYDHVEYNVLILAVGYGTERVMDPIQRRQYWSADNLDEEDANIPGCKRWLVSGNGDGGLIDVIRLRIRHFRHESIVNKICDEWLNRQALRDLVKELARIELDAIEKRNAGRPYDTELHLAYSALVERPEIRVLRTQLTRREDTTVTLSGSSKHPVTMQSCVLNRFLLYLVGDIPYEGRTQTCTSSASGGYHVVFDSGKELDVDDVVVRHGAISALQYSFPDVWERCGALRQRNALDQTRSPIYGAFYTRKRSVTFSRRDFLIGACAGGIMGMITSHPIRYSTYNLRFAGSGTMGEALVPALVTGFLRKDYGMPSTVEYTHDSSPSLLDGHLDYHRTLFESYHVVTDCIGSRAAIPMLKTLNYEFGMASSEQSAKEFDEFVIAMDGIVIIVNSSNPVSNLTADELRGIFREDIRNWSVVGGNNVPISMHAFRQSDSGTVEFFTSTLFADPTQYASAHITDELTSAAMVDNVSKEPGGIAYFGMNGLAHLTDKVKLLSVDGVPESASVSQLMLENDLRVAVKMNRYPLSRPLFLYMRNERDQIVEQFIEYVTGIEGQQIVREAGFVDILIDGDDSLGGNGYSAVPFNTVLLDGAAQLKFEIDYQPGKFHDSQVAETTLRELTKWLRCHLRRVSELVVVAVEGGSHDALTIALSTAQEVAHEIASHLSRYQYADRLTIAFDCVFEPNNQTHRLDFWVKQY